MKSGVISFSESKADHLFLII